MKRFESPARLGLFTALVAAIGIVAAGVLSLPSEAFAAASPCDDKAALQRRLDDFDARWNASDAWGLTAQFATDGSLAASGDAGRQAVYRELVEGWAAHSSRGRRAWCVRRTWARPAWSTCRCAWASAARRGSSCWRMRAMAASWRCAEKRKAPPGGSRSGRKSASHRPGHTVEGA